MSGQQGLDRRRVGFGKGERDQGQQALPECTAGGQITLGDGGDQVRETPGLEVGAGRDRSVASQGQGAEDLRILTGAERVGKICAVVAI